MTQDEIIRMAREAGFETEDWANGTHVIVYESGREIDITNELERFAALVAAHEREACAKVCEEVADDYRGLQYDFCGNNLAEVCAADIRARGEK